MHFAPGPSEPEPRYVRPTISRQNTSEDRHPLIKLLKKRSKSRHSTPSSSREPSVPTIDVESPVRPVRVH